MLIEQQKRQARVRFRHPIRVVTLDGQPRVIRTLTANVSRKGLFLRMPEPLPPGTKVALSLEAGGRALALAQAEVRWGRRNESELAGRYAGCGVRFTEFMHPRAKELVEYLVENLDRGKPLTLPEKGPWWRRVRVPAAAAMVALFVGIAGLPAVQRLVVEPAAAPEPVVPVALDVDRTTTPEAVAVPEVPGLSAEVEQAALHAQAGEVEPEQASAPGLSEPVEDGPKGEPVAVKEMATPGLSEPVEDGPKSPPVAVQETAAPGLSEPVEDGPRSAPRAVDAPLPNPLPAVAGRGRTVVNPLPDPLPRGGEGGAGKGRKGSVKLPTGAAPALAWSVSGSELRLAPELVGGAHVKRAFVLEGPPRAVFDLSGAVPSKSLTVPASPPYASGVRLGKQPGGTRIVVDLDSAPRRSRQADGALVLSF